LENKSSANISYYTLISSNHTVEQASLLLYPVFVRNMFSKTEEKDTTYLISFSNKLENGGIRTRIFEISIKKTIQILSQILQIH
jgi:hypothetical protein